MTASAVAELRGRSTAGARAEALYFWDKFDLKNKPRLHDYLTAMATTLVHHLREKARKIRYTVICGLDFSCFRVKLLGLLVSSFGLQGGKTSWGQVSQDLSGERGFFVGMMSQHPGAGFLTFGGQSMKALRAKAKEEDSTIFDEPTLKEEEERARQHMRAYKPPSLQ